MSRNTLLANLTPLIRNLTDLALKLGGTLVAYDNITLYRYSIDETKYRDKTKTLLETVTDISMFIDFPGEVPYLNTTSTAPANTTVTFIEDLLPIVAIFPWKHNGVDLKVDIDDEFIITLIDEFDNNHSLRFEITERKADFVEQFIYKEFIVVPKREDTVDLTLTDPTDPTSTPKDENIEVGKEDKPVYSYYD
jgi:hypothetical protein